MDFLFTDEQFGLRATGRGFLAGKSAEETVRELTRGDGADAAVRA
jgi:hypothetical protein